MVNPWIYTWGDAEGKGERTLVGLENGKSPNQDQRVNIRCVIKSVFTVSQPWSDRFFICKDDDDSEFEQLHIKCVLPEHPIRRALCSEVMEAKAKELHRAEDETLNFSRTGTEDVCTTSKKRKVQFLKDAKARKVVPKAAKVDMRF